MGRRRGGGGGGEKGCVRECRKEEKGRVCSFDR